MDNAFPHHVQNHEWPEKQNDKEQIKFFDCWSFIGMKDARESNTSDQVQQTNSQDRLAALYAKQLHAA